MDPVRDILYRNFLFNDANIEEQVVPGGGLGSGIYGCVTEVFDLSDLDVVQFMEKKSESDGMDTGGVFLGTRRVRASGSLYALDRPSHFDAYQDMRRAMSPTLAYREEPGDKGYRPLYFSVPTESVDFPAGVITKYVLAMPRAFQAAYQREQHGGDDDEPLALAWQATWLCRDPNIYGDRIEAEFPTGGDGPPPSISGSWTNRGDYHTPLNMSIYFPAAACVLTCNVGGSQFTITLAASTGERLVRFKGFDQVITVEEDDVESLLYGALDFQNDTTWPLVPAGASDYDFSFSTGTIGSSGTSLAWFDEAWA